VFKERALAGSYDIVWANNAVYLALREKGMVSVIARGEPSFRGMVVILKDAPYTVVSDLKGARIAAVSPESIAGFLFLKKLFANEGMDIYSDSTLSFASKVESIPFLVVNGKADAGVFVEDLYLRSPTYDAAMARLRILVKSPPIPQFPFAVKKSMDPGLVKALEKALSEFDGSTEDERSFLYELRLDKIITADDASYDEFSVFYKEMQS
jgi:phosphonate transport system substrate-binding protein